VEKTRMKFKQDSLSGAVEETSVDWRGRICKSKHGGMAAAVFVLGFSLSLSLSPLFLPPSHPPFKCVFLCIYMYLVNSYTHHKNSSLYIF
jgi:hypothetical protein